MPSRNDGTADTTIDALADAIIGQRRTFTRHGLAKRTGVAEQVNAARWRTLGFPPVHADDLAFTNADADMLRVVQKMLMRGAVDPADEEALLRAVGRTFSRLAEWQARAMMEPLLEEPSDKLSRRKLRDVRRLVKWGGAVQQQIWRRHLTGAVTRLLLQAGESAGSQPSCAGFVDIVGYTSRTRSMTDRELAALVAHFESVVTDLIAEHDGRVVKTIGDEIFFVVDDPIEAAWLGLELVQQHLYDATFPNVRVGMAHGHMLDRLGDVLGPVVNLASRLTSVARPGRVIVDAALAERVEGTPGLRLRQMRRMYVKGFEPVEPWSIKPAREGRTSIRGALGDILDDATDDLTMRLP